MKKVMKSIICCLLCIALSGVLAFAEGETSKMNMDWHTDYETNKLIINFKSPAEFKQVVSVVMYPEGETPTFGNYVRIWEKPMAPGEVGEVSFTLTDTLTKEDGKYKVRIQGSGLKSNEYKEEDTVTIRKPSVAGTLLSNINGAAGSDTETFFENQKDALQIEIYPGERQENMVEAFINIRDVDYEGFDNLNEVRDAYKKADIIVCLQKDINTDVIDDNDINEIINKVKKNADAIDLDVTDEDYDTYKEDIYKQILTERETYNGGISNIQTLKDAITEYRAVAVVNNSDQETLLEKVPVYYDDFGSSESYSVYSGFTLANKEKVVRQLWGKDFSSAAEIKTAFDAAVTTVSNSLGDAGGPGGDASDTPSKDPGNLGGSTVETPLPLGTFKDCDKNHWAYSYIKELSEAGIIDGYTDGTFLPEKKVNREEFVKMIIAGTGLYNASAEVDFADIPKTAWSYKYVASAKDAGIVSGVTEDAFGAGGVMTRQDVAVIISRVVDKFNIEVPSSSAMKVFKDEASMSDYAVDAIETLVRLGIIDGFADETFRPKDALTRAQAAKIISLVRALI